MTTLSDTFARTGNLDGSGPGGWTWTREQGTANSASTAPSFVTQLASTYEVAYANSALSGSDQFGQITITGLNSSANSYLGCVVRYDPTGDTGYYGWFQAGNFKVSKFHGTALTQIGGNTAGTIADGDVLRVEISGSTITVKKNGTTVKTVTDTTYSAGLYTGIIIYGGGANNTIQGSNWSGGDLSTLTSLTAYFTAPGDSLTDAAALAIGGAGVLSGAAAVAGMGPDALIAGTSINLGATESLTRATATGTASGNWLTATAALHTAAGDWLLSATATAAGLLDTLGTAITNLTAHGAAALDWLAGVSAQTSAAADTTTAVAAHASAASGWLSSVTAQATTAADTLTAATAYATGLADSLGTGVINLTAFGSGALEWTAGGVSLAGVPFTWGAFILATTTTVPAFARTTTVPAFTRTTTVPRY